MLTLKVIWPSDFVNYNVYTAIQYGVYELSDGTTQLLIHTGGVDPIDIRLSSGAKVYVMNDRGSTVDTIVEFRNNTAPLQTQAQRGLSQAVA